MEFDELDLDDELDDDLTVTSSQKETQSHSHGRPTKYMSPLAANQHGTVIQNHAVEPNEALAETIPSSINQPLDGSIGANALISVPSAFAVYNGVYGTSISESHRHNQSPQHRPLTTAITSPQHIDSPQVSPKTTQRRLRKDVDAYPAAHSQSERVSSHASPSDATLQRSRGGKGGVQWVDEDRVTRRATVDAHDDMLDDDEGSEDRNDRISSRNRIPNDASYPYSAEDTSVGRRHRREMQRTQYRGRRADSGEDYRNLARSTTEIPSMVNMVCSGACADELKLQKEEYRARVRHLLHSNQLLRGEICRLTALGKDSVRVRIINALRDNVSEFRCILGVFREKCEKMGVGHATLGEWVRLGLIRASGGEKRVRDEGNVAAVTADMERVRIILGIPEKPHRKASSQSISSSTPRSSKLSTTKLSEQHRRSSRERRQDRNSTDNTSDPETVSSHRSGKMPRREEKLSGPGWSGKRGPVGDNSSLSRQLTEDSRVVIMDLSSRVSAAEEALEVSEAKVREQDKIIKSHYHLLQDALGQAHELAAMRAELVESEEERTRLETVAEELKSMLADKEAQYTACAVMLQQARMLAEARGGEKDSKSESPRKGVGKIKEKDSKTHMDKRKASSPDDVETRSSSAASAPLSASSIADDARVRGKEVKAMLATSQAVCGSLEAHIAELRLELVASEKRVEVERNKARDRVREVEEARERERGEWRAKEDRWDRERRDLEAEIERLKRSVWEAEREVHERSLEMDVHREQDLVKEREWQREKELLIAQKASGYADSGHEAFYGNPEKGIGIPEHGNIAGLGYATKGHVMENPLRTPEATPVRSNSIAAGVLSPPPARVSPPTAARAISRTMSLHPTPSVSTSPGLVTALTERIDATARDGPAFEEFTVHGADPANGYEGMPAQAYMQPVTTITVTHGPPQMQMATGGYNSVPPSPQVVMKQYGSPFIRENSTLPKLMEIPGPNVPQHDSRVISPNMESRESIHDIRIKIPEFKSPPSHNFNPLSFVSPVAQESSRQAFNPGKRTVTTGPIPLAYGKDLPTLPEPSPPSKTTTTTHTVAPADTTLPAAIAQQPLAFTASSSTAPTAARLPSLAPSLSASLGPSLAASNALNPASTVMHPASTTMQVPTLPRAALSLPPFLAATSVDVSKMPPATARVASTVTFATPVIPEDIDMELNEDLDMDIDADDANLPITTPTEPARSPAATATNRDADLMLMTPSSYAPSAALSPPPPSTVAPASAAASIAPTSVAASIAKSPVPTGKQSVNKSSTASNAKTPVVPSPATAASPQPSNSMSSLSSDLSLGKTPSQSPPVSRLATPAPPPSTSAASAKTAQSSLSSQLTLSAATTPFSPASPAPAPTMKKTMSTTSVSSKAATASTKSAPVSTPAPATAAIPGVETPAPSTAAPAGSAATATSRAGSNAEAKATPAPVSRTPTPGLRTPGITGTPNPTVNSGVVSSAPAATTQGKTQAAPSANMAKTVASTPVVTALKTPVPAPTASNLKSPISTPAVKPPALAVSAPPEDDDIMNMDLDEELDMDL